MRQSPSILRKPTVNRKKKPSLSFGLLDAPGPLQKRYVHGLVTEIVVNSETATISGQPLALAAAVASPEKLGEVRSFEREWRTRRDSNS